MTNSELFKQAHAMTRQTVRSGDSYQVTFGACLKLVRKQAGQHKEGYIVASSLDTGDTIMIGDYAYVIAETTIDKGTLCLTLGENGMVKDYDLDTLIYRFKDYWQAMDTLPAM